MFEDTNYGFIPKTAAPEGVDERTHVFNGLYAYCNSNRDEKCKAESAEMFGETVSLTADARTRNRFLGRAVVAHNGFIGQPDSYMKAAGMEFPARFKDKGDLYEHVGARIHEKMRGAWDAEQEEKRLQDEAVDKARQGVRTAGVLAWSPQDVVRLKAQGLDVASVERAQRAFQAVREVQDGGAVLNESLDKAFNVLNGDKQAEELFFDAVSEVAAGVYAGGGDTGNAFGDLFSGFGHALFETADNVVNPVGVPVMDEDATLEYMKAGIDPAAVLAEQKDVAKGNMAFRARVRSVVEEARENGYDKAGFTFSKYTGKFGRMAGDLLPWMLGGGVGGALKVASVASATEGIAESAAAAAPGAGLDEVWDKAAVYGAGYAGSMLVGAGAAKAGLLAIPGARALAAKVAPRAAGFMAKGFGESVVAGVSRYAYAMGVAAVDMSMIRPAVAWTVEQAGYDLWAGNPELATATQEFAAAVSGIVSEDTVMASVLFGALGGRHVRLRAKAALAGRDAALVLGVGEKVADKMMVMAPEKRGEYLGKEFVRQWRGNSGSVMQRAVDELKRRKQVALQGARREEAVVKASMRYLFGVDYEEAGDGRYKVYSGGSVDEKGEWVRGGKVEEMSADDLEVYIQHVEGKAVSQMNYLFKDAVGRKRLVDAFKELNGDVEVKWLDKAVTEREMRRLLPLAEERLELRKAELAKGGMDAVEAERAARGEVHKDLHKTFTLGDLLTVARSLPARGGLERAREGALTGEVDTEGKASKAFVLTRENVGMERGKRILYIANGASAREVAEEVGEQVYQDFAAENRLSPIGVYQHLRALQEAVAGSGVEGAKEAARSFLTLAEQSPELDKRLMAMDAGDVFSLGREELQAVDMANTEAVSFLMFNDLSQRVEAGDTELPGWAHSLFARAGVEKMRLHHDVALAAALANLRAKAPGDGGMGEGVRGLLGLAPEAVEKALRGRGEPSMEEYMDAFTERLNRQNELDAAYGRGKLHDPVETEDFARRADEGQAEVEREREEQEKQESEAARKVVGEAEADPGNEGKSHADVVRDVAEKRADAKTEEIKGSPDAVQDAAFEGGVCLEIADEGGLLCRGGYVAVEKLGIMPNFKLGADEKTGVAQPLKGDYRPDHDPIRVWRRADGSLEVISGRHRLDACKRAGVGRIMCYVYDETPTRNEQWARRYDIESNIRDNQASVVEVALYVRGEFTDGVPLSDEQVTRAGIAREGKQGAKGFRIGRRGTDAVLDALRNNRISEDEALAISDFCPGNEPVQRAGLAMVLAGESKACALARMEGELAVQQVQAEIGESGGYDFFGIPLGNDGFMDFAAKYVARRRNELAKDASYLTTNVKRKNAAEMARKYGVDIKDAEGMKKKLAEINMLRERWKRPYTDPELMDEMKKVYRGGDEGGIAASLADAPRGSLEESAGARALDAAYGVGSVHYSIRKGLESYERSMPRKSFLKAYREYRQAMRYFGSAGFGRANARMELSKAWETGDDKVIAYAQRGVEFMEADYNRLDAIATEKGKVAVEACTKAFAALEERYLVPLQGWDIMDSESQSKMLYDLYLKGTLTREEYDSFDNLVQERRRKDEEAKALILDAQRRFNWSAEKSPSWKLTPIKSPSESAAEAHFSAVDERTLESNQVKIGNKAIVTFTDGVPRKETALVLHPSGREEWGHVPAIPQLEEAGFNEADIYMELGNSHYGYVHYLMRHGQEIQDMYPDVPLYEAARRFFDETLGSIEKLHVENPYSAKRGAVNRLAADTKPYNKEDGTAKQRLIVLNFKKKQNRYVFMTSYEHAAGADKMRKGEGSVTITEDGLTLTLLAPLEGEVAGLPADTTHTPSRKPASDTRRLSGENSITADSPVKADSLDFEFLRKIRHPEEEQGNRAHFSIAGKKAKGYADALDRGETYVDKADGHEKFVISTKGARLNSGFTMGMLNCPVGGHKDVSLPALLHFPELYRNYPELAEVRVRVYTPKGDEPFLGFATFKDKGTGEAPYIGVNMEKLRRFPDKEARLLETLLHESQHMIQHVEGHGRGGSVGSPEKAIEMIEEAIVKRKEKGVDDDWSRDNLAWLEDLRRRVETTKDNLAMKMLLFEVYRSLHGEQEARWTGGRKGDEGAMPMDADVGLTGRAPGHETIYLDSPPEFSDLGGVTYAGLGRWGYLLEERAPKGDFGYDRRLYQMMEAVRRRMRELHVHRGDSAALGLQLSAEGLAMIDQINSLLPNQYKMALEPYKLYFNFYAELHGSGDPERAAGIIPMAGWDKRMAGAMRKMAMELMEGEARAGDMKYWLAHPELMRLVDTKAEEARDAWEKAQAEAREAFADDLEQYNGKPPRRILKEMREFAEAKFAEDGGGEFFEVAFRALGEIRADKLMDKFLQRVTLLMDQYRKDVTLGRIRRVVDNLTPLPGKDGKPVKGRMDARSYAKVMDMVALLELTPGQVAKFFRTRYLGDETPEGQAREKAWAELAPEDLVTVETYDVDGKALSITCTKQEFDTFAGFEQMSAERAEGAARALGEFIATGRQAWENAEEARKERIAQLCAPLLDKFDSSDNAVRGRRAKLSRANLPVVRRALNFAAGHMNDAQFFDSLTGVPEVEVWAQMAHDTVSGAKVYEGAQLRERAALLRRVWAEAAGSHDQKKMDEWFNAANETRDSGVKLVEQEPDFLEQERDTLRGQFLGMLHRKTRQKNFNPNKFAAALRAFADAKEKLVPDVLMQEAMDKFGDIGDAGKYVLGGKEAVVSLLSATELQRLGNLEKAAKERAYKARRKWYEEREEKGKAPIGEPGETLQLTRLEAAYRVLMTEQSDYTEMLRRQGYTPEVVERLKRFAGKDVMTLAYKLRDKLNERTDEVAEIYEGVYGMPFPRVENYFRAFFDAGYEQSGHTVLDGQGGAAAGGGTAKIFYTRQHHNRKIDPVMNVFTAFELGMREQDLLLAYGELPDVLTCILNHRSGGKEMSAALDEAIGVDAKAQLVEHVKNMKQQAAQVEVEGRAILRAGRALGGGVAGTILNGRISSLMKQLTAIFNSVGSDAVSYREWWAARARCAFGAGKLSRAEMESRAELKSRFKGWKESVVDDALLAPADVKAGGRTDWRAKAGLELMEWLDVEANVTSAMTLYDAVYRKMQKEHPEWGEEDLDEVAMHEVRRSLAVKSQPMGWRSRSALAAKQSAFKLGSLFLGGESINTFGRVASLVARGKKGDYTRAAQVWLTHGVALQALTMLYNWLTDDEEQWKRRNIAQYGIGALLGPVMGIPFFSQAVGVGALFAPRSWRPFMPSQSLIPLGDLERAANDCHKVFFGKKASSWQDKCVAVDNCLRALMAVFIGMFRNSTDPRGAAAYGAMYAGSGVLNLLDFLLRTERAVEERALGK